MAITFFLTESFNELPKLVFLSPVPDMGKGYAIATLSSKDTYFEHAITEEKEKADFFLVPHYVKEDSAFTRKEIEKRVLDAKKFGKKVCVFLSGDYADRIWFPDVLLFKMTQYQGQKKGNEIIMPPISEDLLRSYPTTIRTKQEKPFLGFCGWANASLLKYLYLSFQYMLFSTSDFLFQTRYVPKIKGLYFRIRLLNILKKSPHLQTLFVTRKSFSGRLDSIELQPEKARNEFVSTIQNTDISICVKGDGNHSVRFFESLSLGRPVVLLDTDVVLPLPKTIPYDHFVIRVPYTDLKKAHRQVKEYWDSITDSDFKKMQEEARTAYETYLSVPLFLSFVFKKLKEGYTADTL